MTTTLSAPPVIAPPVAPVGFGSRRPPTSRSYSIDEDEVLRGLDLLAPAVFELRCIGCKIEGEWRKGTYSGYFDREHFGAVIDALRKIERTAACYFTPNPVKPDLLGRAFNRARIISDREPTTTDKDIAERLWLLIDVDAVRPSGVSATAAEREATLELATAVDYELFERGFPPGVIGDSGNGSHVMIPVRLKADDGGFCQRLLKSLAKQFNSERATIDETVFNPARIWKLPGTLVCKGDNAPEIGRVWRLSKILTVCNKVQ